MPPTLNTYQDLLDFLNGCTLAQLEQTITIHDSNEDEYYPVRLNEHNWALHYAQDTDVLDKGHLYLEF